MSYPPQPGPHQPQDPYGQGAAGYPRQDPYGQGAGGYPQQDPYGQGGYPQQDPYGQGGYPQYDPYGQQGGYPPQGGYPYGQQGGYPQQDPYGQFAPYPGYGQPGGMGGPPGQPPGKGKTNLWIALSVGAVVIIAAVLITGFITPGFFTGDDEGAEAASGSDTSEPTSSSNQIPKPNVDPSGGNSPSQPGGNTGGKMPNAIAQEFLRAVNNGDRAAAEGMYCPGDSTTHTFTEAIEGNTNISLAEPIEDPSESSTTSTGDLTGTVDGQPVDGTLYIFKKAKNNTEWCVSAFYPSTG
ncbi:MAG: hypothetical protein GEU98_07280 [Pseudonocardiaceae bacterium]|nr:hypothetical protein [Pseudonocardiaceae bacterium]